MYRYLKARLPTPLADALCGLWYAVLAVLIFYCFDDSAAHFYYLHR